MPTGAKARPSRASFQFITNMAINAPNIIKIWLNISANACSMNSRTREASSTTRFMSSPDCRELMKDMESPLIL